MVLLLGLQRGMVRIVDHDPGWARAFEAERATFVDALEGLRFVVEHIGSTAVPGLPAKPIIDIAIGVRQTSDVGECLRRLEARGYEYRGDAGGQGGHLLVRGAGDVRTHHVHVVVQSDPQWGSYLALRDLLRGDPGARERYAEAKRALAGRFADDRASYLREKTKVVDRLLR